MRKCLHCNEVVTTAYYGETGPFCCQGCLTVYNIIKLKGLSEYYDIKKNVSAFKKRAPVELSLSKYTYLDDADFLTEYSYKNIHSKSTMEFYLEGIHCLACLWIIEKLPELVSNVSSSRLNMGRSVVTISLTSSGNFSDVAKELDNFGYRPHPLKMNQSSSEFKTKEDRAIMLRIGIAGAAAGNIMLYAISLYAGAGPEYEVLFNALTVVFALPVLTYCAFPFYKNSYVALKNKSLSIDVPISLALIMGAAMGIYNLAINVFENYFDSLTALVFLLLLSRYFLKVIQEKGLSTSDLHFFYQGESVLKMDDAHSGVFQEIHPKFLKVKDLIKIGPNQMIPADSIVMTGESYVNNSLLTGESHLQKVKEYDEVYSGTMNVSSEIIIEVKSINQETRLGKILKSVENGWGQKAKIVDITNLVSRYFVAVVFSLSIILFLWGLQKGDVKHALEQALTLLIVTCPCALAIATPLTFIRTLSKSALKGMIIKDDAVIEKLAQAKNVFIDKTGTITMNNLKVVSMKAHAPASLDLSDIIHNMEKHSRHPVAMGLKELIKDNHYRELEVLDFKETPGIGVSGIIEGHFFEIKNHTIYEDHALIASFTVKDTIRPDAIKSIENLRSLNLNLQVLSGDKKEFVSEIATEIKLRPGEYLSELSPEKKSEIVKNSSRSIMIGDGANDAIALSCAETGIAVFGAMDISLRAADIYLSYPGLSSVIDLIVISRETMKVIYRNLVLSLCYNSLSVFLAFTGRISPLTAAIIMPLSSLTVLVSTILGTKELRRQWK